MQKTFKKYVSYITQLKCLQNLNSTLQIQLEQTKK